MKVYDRRLVAQNSKFELYFDDIEDDTGSRVSDYLIVTPKYSMPNLVTGLVVLPVRDTSIGLIQIYRHALKKTSWEAVRGFVDPGESSLTVSAARELREEMNLEAEKIIPLGYVTSEPGVIAARIGLFVAQVGKLPEAQTKPAEIGHVGFHFFSIDEVKTLMQESEIEDASTLCCIFRYLQKCHA